MPDFWQFPTVSMGLSPIMAIYQARFNRYLEDRGLKKPDDQKIWAFLGDGEMDEPESLGAITLAAREKLDNLIFVVNCNLQRLDGPVRGNGKIIQELEAVFRGAGWNVIKVIWGGDWDPLLAHDETVCWCRRMEEVPDGQYQKYSVSGGDYIRKDFFGKYPRTRRNGQPLYRRAAVEAAPRRARSREGLRRLQSRRRPQGLADRDSGQNHQRIRAGRGRRGAQCHPPAEKAQRRGTAPFPQPLRHSDLRRGHRRKPRFTARRKTAKK